MILKLLGLLGVAAGGWALGRMRPQVDLANFILALFGAVTVHSAMDWVFFENRVDGLVGDPRLGAPAPVILLIAAAESVGLWIAFLLVPWARFAGRLWTVLYLLGAATLAAVHYYFPFDLVVVGNTFIPRDGSAYLLAAVACLPIAAIAYFFGFATTRKDDDEDDPLMAGA